MNMLTSKFIHKKRRNSSNKGDANERHNIKQTILTHPIIDVDNKVIKASKYIEML